jgi:hypothetical protein
MSNTAILVVFLVVLALLLVHYRPSKVEGFAVAAVDPIRMPACAERSPAAQRILAAIAHYPESDEGAAEIRLLLSKLCCMEADVSTAGAGVYRTLPLQFRTSHDMEPPTSFVGRCLRNAVRQRDIDLVMDKFEKRGRALIQSRCPESRKDFDEVIASTRLAFVSFCLGDQPSMDKPMGARDVGFWAPEDTDLMQYQGVSSSPK